MKVDVVMVRLIGMKNLTGVLASLTIRYTVTSGVRRDVESSVVVLTRVYVAIELMGKMNS